MPFIDLRETAAHLAITAAFLASTLVVARAALPSEPSASEFDPAEVEIVVVGSPHLRNMAPEDKPAIDLIRRGLARFEPDHVVVEWLHPSIDPATTNNYRPFEGLPVLARLWGYDLGDVATAADHTREVLDAQKQHGLPTASTRVELGKLYYLQRDRLNAGYQWWIAERLGADVSDLKRLTRDNFEGHELEVWGFPIAHGQGLEYITPFDYQGEDAAWIWSDIVHAVAVHALATTHGLQEGDEGWDAAYEDYGRELVGWANEGDPAWMEHYGDIEEVAEFAEVVEIWTARRNRERPNSGPPGLSAMRYNQSPRHSADSRYMYDELFPMISLDGLGRQLVDNYELRNLRMADFVEQDVKKLGTEQVLIIVGESHRPFLVEIFKERGYAVTPASRFIP